MLIYFLILFSQTYENNLYLCPFSTSGIDTVTLFFLLLLLTGFIGFGVNFFLTFKYVYRNIKEWYFQSIVLKSEGNSLKLCYFLKFCLGEAVGLGSASEAATADQQK